MTRSALALVATIAVVVAVVPTGATAGAATQPVLGSSVWPCPDWGMYGRTEMRTFSTDCPSGLAPASASSLAPQWFFKTRKTVTASPVVVDGVVFVGDWSGTMYALDDETGELLWETATEAAPEAPFGPIVSSAAVTEVRAGGEVRRLVIFGSGPRLYALDATDGSEVWVLSVAEGDIQPGEETQIESSPVVWDGMVYFGMDTHNDPVAETGGEMGALVAVDAATGREHWRFVPNHEGQSGCESIWSSPTIDAADGLIFAATGNCPHPDYEWGPYQEAVIALDLHTGRPVWSFQPHEPNLRDEDFGATPNLFSDTDGRRVLGIGNKDARYYALDPATGDLLWGDPGRRAGQRPGELRHRWLHRLHRDRRRPGVRRDRHRRTPVLPRAGWHDRRDPLAGSAGPELRRIGRDERGRAARGARRATEGVRRPDRRSTRVPTADGPDLLRPGDRRRPGVRWVWNVVLGRLREGGSRLGAVFAVLRRGPRRDRRRPRATGPRPGRGRPPGERRARDRRSAAGS